MLGRMPSVEDAAGSYHLDSLRQAFPYTRDAPGEDSTSRYFSVEQTAAQFAATPAGSAPPSASGTPFCKSDLTIYLTLPPAFPQDAPLLTTFGGTVIPVAWDPKRSLLGETVREAFLTLRAWWGPMAPPTLADVPPVPHFSDDIIEDLLRNPNALESYVFQLPYAKALRASEKSMLDDLDLMSDRGLELHLNVEQLKKDVDELWKVAVEQGALLDEARRDASAFLQFGTPELLLKALAAECQLEQQRSASLSEQFLHPHGALGSVSSDCGSVTSSSLGSGLPDDEETLESYFESRAAYHQLDLKRRLYSANH